MAFKFSKADSQRLANIRDRLAVARSELDEVIEKEIATIEDSYAAMNAAVETYNDFLGEARGFVEDLANEHEGEYDDKSENWQDGERGQATRQWLDALQEVYDTRLDDVEDFVFESPALAGMEPEDHAEIIDNIPPEPEY